MNPFKAWNCTNFSAHQKRFHVKSTQFTKSFQASTTEGHDDDHDAMDIGHIHTTNTTKKTYKYFYPLKTISRKNPVDDRKTLDKIESVQILLTMPEHWRKKNLSKVLLRYILTNTDEPNWSW